jgi:broad specificity phosphatase PhoE
VPARVLIARHAEATYRHPELISDEGGWLTRKGVVQASDLGATLRAERPTRVYTSTMHPNDTVLVISHGGVMSMAVPRLCANIPDHIARRHYLPNCAVVPVHVAHGVWRMLGDWPGQARWK